MNEPVLPRAILIDKETGQHYDVDLKSDINPFPLPDDEFEETIRPVVFQQSFTVKVSKNDRMAFKRLMRKHKKIPRKLKKALRHVGFFTGEMKRIETANGSGYEQDAWFGPKDGYPMTKYVNRACLKLKTNAILIIERQFKDLLPQTP